VSRSRTRPALAAVAISVAAATAALTGCSSMDAALGQQWVDVTFKPSTTVAMIQKVRATCSHVANVTAYPLPKKHTVLNLMAGVRFNTTNASDANVAQLQQCVQKFTSVQGFTPGDTGDEGG
jgi:hypothetical protein